MYMYRDICILRIIYYKLKEICITEIKNKSSNVTRILKNSKKRILFTNTISKSILRNHLCRNAVRNANFHARTHVLQ